MEDRADAAYTSSWLAHFVGWGTRDVPGHEEIEFDRLTKILETGCLSSRAAEDPAYRCTEGIGGVRIDRSARFTSDELFMQSCVCFCDIPHEALGIHVSKYGRFGLAFEKSFLVPKGASPAFYVATDSLGIVGKGRGEYFDERIENYFALKDLIEENRTRLMKDEPTKKIVEHFGYVASFLEFTVLGLLKPFDSHLPDANPRNVYMEREWRVLGDVSFHRADVSAVYVPESFRERIQTRFPELIGRVLAL